MPKNTKTKHVWELIQELDVWMQHAIQFQLDYQLDAQDSIQAFERARNIIADAFPHAASDYKDRA
jgi:hypothetical protein